MTRFARVLATVSVAAVAAVGFAPSAFGQDDGATERSDLNFIVVSHGQASDPFWSVVQQGVAQAAEDMGVNAEYQAPRRPGLTSQPWHS
jgi:simple sugar transport system substrate-binding protein